VTIPPPRSVNENQISEASRRAGLPVERTNALDSVAPLDTEHRLTLRAVVRGAVARHGNAPNGTAAGRLIHAPEVSTEPTSRRDA